MKYFVSLFAIGLMLGCGKDENNAYPKTYTLNRIEQSDEGLYLVDSPTELSDLPANIGSYEAHKDEVKQEIRDLVLVAFDLKELVLLSDDSLRIHFFVDEEEYDTTLNYTVIQDSIDIESIQGGLFTYDKEEDTFVICGVTSFAIAGPNVINPGLEYSQLNTIECTPGYSNKDYAFELLNGFDYADQDTLGILLTKFIYK